jgi:hypothetical protein
MAGTKAEEEEEEEEEEDEEKTEKECGVVQCDANSLPISPLLDYFCCLMGELLAWPLPKVQGPAINEFKQSYWSKALKLVSPRPLDEGPRSSNR